MTERLVVIDTETTGTDPRLHYAWQAAAATVDLYELEDGRVTAVDHEYHHWTFPPPDLDDAEPEALAISGFYEARATLGEWAASIHAAEEIARFTAGRIITGANVVFDRDFLAKLLRRHHVPPAWNARRPFELEAYVAGMFGLLVMPSLSECARLLDIDPDGYERHTALGDVTLTVHVLRRALELRHRP